MEANLNSGQTSSLAEYSEIDAGIDALRQKYEGRVYDVTTTAGMKDAKIARAEVRGQRTELEKIRKAIKAPVIDRGRLIDSEAKRINAVLLEIEDPINVLIREQEAARAAEKAGREAAERRRVEDIQDRINELRFLLSEYHPTEDIKEWWDKLAETHIDDTYGEFQSRALEVLEAEKQKCGEAMRAAFVRENAEQRAKASLKAQEETEAKEQAQRDRVLKEQAATQAIEAEKLAAERADLERQKAEVVKAHLLEAKMAEDKADKEAKAKELLEAKCGSHLLALRKVLEVCYTETWSHATKVRRIIVIAEANIRGKSSEGA